MTLKNYSTINTENNDAVPNGAPDGMLPSNVIDVFRQLMADQRTQWNDAEWIEYLDGTKDGTVQYTSSNQFQITGADVSNVYHVGRRVKIVGSSVIYGTITNVANTSNITTVTIDNTLINESIQVFLSILSSENDAIPREVIEDIVGNMVTGNSESGITVSYQDTDGTIDFTVDNQTDENFTSALKTKLDGIEAGANNYTYIHPTGGGNLHIPGGGNVGDLLENTSSGTAAWMTPDYANSSHTHSNYIASNTNDTASGVISFSNSTNSNSKDNGAVVLTNGGLGVEGNINAGGNVTAYATSDKHKKKHIERIDGALAKLNQLSGNSFHYRDPKTDADQGKQYGVIAQEVRKIFPEMIIEDQNGTLSIRQAGFELTALLIEAVKELSEKIEQMEKRHDITK